MHSILSRRSRLTRAGNILGIGLLAALVSLWISGSLFAQRPKELVARPGQPDIDTEVTQPKLVHVVDEQNQPLAEAEVRVGWWEDAEGDLLLRAIINPPKTNAEGKVMIDVPRGAVRAQISAVAPEFAAEGAQYSLSGEPKIVLKRGQIVRVRAVDEEGNPVPEAVPLLENSRRWPHEFNAVPGEPGLFVSPVVDLERRWLRVADANGEGPLRFSELIDSRNPADTDQQGNILAVLKPGIRLEGKLDASVPRPVKAGCVELYIKEGALHRIEPQGWTWEDMAVVEEEGKFVFPSLPRGGHVQLVAVVEGYQSIRPSPEQLMNYLLEHDAADPELLKPMFDRHDSYWPHLFPLPLDQDQVAITLPCTPTSGLDVKVADPLGQPISGATIRFNPNGYFLGGNLFIPGTGGFKDAARVREDNDHYTKIREWAQSTLLAVESDQEGIARVRCLPAEGRDSYRVEADGYVLPVHPTSSPGSDSRYATIDLEGGKTQRRTITLEKFVPCEARTLTVVDHEGRPLEEITAIVTEVAFEEDEANWHLWSTARFGPVANATSASDGTLTLQVPVEAAGQNVARLRLFLKGRVGKEGSVHGERLTIPPRADDKIIVLTVSDEPAEPHGFRDVEAKYVSPDEVLKLPPPKLLARLVEAPSLLLLKRLLDASGFEEATPLELRGNSNLLQSSNAPPVVRIETEAGPRVVALCYVRPKDAPWKESPKLSSPPEAAFIFDPQDASLQGMVGGWTSSKGSPCRLTLTELGPPGDYFFKAFALEENRRYGYFEQWTLVRQPKSPALTFYTPKLGPAWSADDSKEEGSPPAEFGYLDFRPDSAPGDTETPGWLKNGARVPRKIYWDAELNQFLGPAEQWFESDPLYEVDLERSAAFQPMKVSAGEIVVGGARRAYRNWHAWDVAIPVGSQAVVQLLLVKREEDQPGVETVVRKIHEAELPSGLHFLQLHVGNAEKAEDNTESSVVKLILGRNGSGETPEFTLPHIPVSDSPSVPEVPVLRMSLEAIDLVRLPTGSKENWLVWRLVGKRQ